jgi:hypothetical protein
LAAGPDGGSADPARAWSAVAGAAIVADVLVSKAAIRVELGSRLAEFAPPGEQLQGLFVDERGQIPFTDSTSTPVYVLLTTNYVLFVGIKSFGNAPTRTLGTVPRQAIRFDPPDHGITHFSVRAQLQDQQGRVHRIRFRIAQKWRPEATALTAAASGSPPGRGAPEPGPGY